MMLRYNQLRGCPNKSSLNSVDNIIFLWIHTATTNLLYFIKFKDSLLLKLTHTPCPNVCSVT